MCGCAWPHPKQCGRSWAGTGAHQVSVSPAPACAKLCCPGSWSGSCPAWEATKRGRGYPVGQEEPGHGQAQHLASSSLWGPCLGKLVMFGSLLQSRDPAVNSIKAVLGKGGINYPDEKDEQKNHVQRNASPPLKGFIELRHISPRQQKLQGKGKHFLVSSFVSLLLGWDWSRTELCRRNRGLMESVNASTEVRLEAALR